MKCVRPYVHQLGIKLSNAVLFVMYFRHARYRYRGPISMKVFSTNTHRYEKLKTNPVLRASPIAQHQGFFNFPFQSICHTQVKNKQKIKGYRRNVLDWRSGHFNYGLTWDSTWNWPFLATTLKKKLRLATVLTKGVPAIFLSLIIITY